MSVVHAFLLAFLSNELVMGFACMIGVPFGQVGIHLGFCFDKRLCELVR